MYLPRFAYYYRPSDREPAICARPASDVHRAHTLYLFNNIIDVTTHCARLCVFIHTFTIPQKPNIQFEAAAAPAEKQIKLQRILCIIALCHIEIDQYLQYLWVYCGFVSILLESR